MKKKKGYALLITIILTLVMTLTTITMLTIVYRYTGIINKRKAELQDKVYSEEVSYDSYSSNI